jgi:hypothetical protein
VKVGSGAHNQIYDVMSGSRYYSRNEFRRPFGLGYRTRAYSVELTWPSGLQEIFRDLPVNRLFVLQETEGLFSSRKFR